MPKGLKFLALLMLFKRRRSTQGNYRSILYQITPLESAKIELGLVQNLDGSSPKIALDQVQNLNPNNNNIEHYQYNNNKGVVAVDFIKLKERRKRIKEDLKREGGERRTIAWNLKKGI